MTQTDETTRLLNTLVRTPALISELLSDIPLNTIQLRPSPEEFSVLESICHLRDIEVEGYTVRIRRLLEEDHPELADIDGARLAAERDYNSQQLDLALEAFESARKVNLEVLRKADDNDLNKRGSLEGVGELSLQSLMTMMAEHDEGHIDDLRHARRLLRLEQ